MSPKPALLPIYSPILLRTPTSATSSSSWVTSSSSSSPRSSKVLNRPPGYSSMERFKRKTRPPHRFRPTHLFFLLVLAIIALPLYLTHQTHYIQLYLTSATQGHAGHYYDSYPSRDLTSHIPAATGGLAEHLDVPLTLEARLSYLLSRPALSQHDAELASRHGCPLQTFGRDDLPIHMHKTEGWKQVGPSEIRKYRSKMVEHMRKVERAGHTLVWNESVEENVPGWQRRGIILVANDRDALEQTRHTLHMLRNVLGSTLPIELYHSAGDIGARSLQDELVRKYNVAPMLDGMSTRGGRQMTMTAAFLASKFTEFIYLDTNSMPLVDPAEMFDSIEYRQSGSVFWAETHKDHPDNSIFRILGRSCSDEHWPTAAGQLMFDKRGNDGLNLAVLHLANHMEREKEIYGQFSDGAENLLRFGFYALGLPYQQASKVSALAGTSSPATKGDAGVCGQAVVHWGLTPQSARHDRLFHPPAAFLHPLLASSPSHLSAALLVAPVAFSYASRQLLPTHIRRPRLDGIVEPTLVRTVFSHHAPALGQAGCAGRTLTLRGPDGSLDASSSLMDGQGIVEERLEEVVTDERVWRALTSVGPGAGVGVGAASASGHGRVHGAQAGTGEGLGQLVAI